MQRSLLFVILSVIGVTGHAQGVWDQRVYEFDYNTPGVYELKVEADEGKLICWITYNEISGFPRSHSTYRNWDYYDYRKASQSSGIAQVTVPCPNGSIPIPELIDTAKQDVSDKNGKWLTLVQKHFRGCLGGRASREGNWVILQAKSSSECPPEPRVVPHPVGFYRW